jgi:VanZ family protein
MKKYKITSLFCLIVLILSVLPAGGAMNIKISNIDKIVHFLLYFLIVAAMFFDNFLNRKKNISKKKLICFFIFAIIFGTVIEIIQYFLPFRSAEWLDLLSNSLGAILGIILISIFYKKIIITNK